MARMTKDQHLERWRTLWAKQDEVFKKGNATQERSQGINADYTAKIKRSHPVFLTAETHQVTPMVHRVLATFDMDDATRSRDSPVRGGAHGARA